MKKLFSILTLCLVAVAAQAQYTYPRFGTAKNDDNTGRVITYGYTSQAATSTIVVTPNKSNTTYAVATLTLSPVINFTVTKSYAADRTVFTFSAAASTRSVTFGGPVVSAGTYTLGSGKRGCVAFIFDGSKYVEENRFSEP